MKDSFNHYGINASHLLTPKNVTKLCSSRVRSEYSLIDSIVRLKDLTSRVASDSMPSVALTDFNQFIWIS